ncbi:hypothetical protein ILYODFUR_035544, partial [Ilyodon furcidens]
MKEAGRPGVNCCSGLLQNRSNSYLVLFQCFPFSLPCARLFFSEDYQDLMAALSENVLTVSMLLSVFFLPGIYANSCDGRASLVIITTPKPTAALSGSCLNVPCSFTAAPGRTVFDSSKETIGAWIKDGNDIYNINNGVNTNL